MPFPRPSLKDLTTRTDSQIANRLGLAALLRRSVLGAFSKVIAGASHLLHGHLDWVFRQMLPDTAETSVLDRWADIYDLGRKSAAAAMGTLSLDVTSAATVPIGTQFQTAERVRFETTLAFTTAVAGTFSVPAKATETGEAGNVAAGMQATMLSPIVGVSSVSTVEAMAGGSSDETDSDLRSRVLARIKMPPHGGAEADYDMWALDIVDVTRAWVFPLHLGPGTIGLSFAVDDLQTGPIPDAGKVTAVQVALDILRPVTAELVVFAPTPLALDPTIRLSPNTSAVQAAVEANLVDLLRLEATPGGTVLVSHLREAISLAAGEYDHELISHTVDVVAGAGELLILGTVTWQS